VAVSPVKYNSYWTEIVFLQVINIHNAYEVLRHIDQWEPTKLTDKELAELPPKEPGKRYEPKPNVAAKNIILDFSTKDVTQTIMRQVSCFRSCPGVTWLANLTSVIGGHIFSQKGTALFVYILGVTLKAYDVT
jgi:hypothetical protein